VAWKDGFCGEQMLLRTFIANINLQETSRKRRALQMSDSDSLFGFKILALFILTFAIYFWAHLSDKYVRWLRRSTATTEGPKTAQMTPF
jgi:hypothetical protein